MKTPILLEGDTKTITTLKQLYMKYDGNIPFVFGSKTYDINNRINAVKTDAPYLLDKLDLHKTRIFNEALTLLGINNANTDKKERLITDEVESNDDLINYYFNCWYKTRKMACDEINEKFGLNISIEIDNEIQKKIKELFNDLDKGDGENESLYDKN